MEERDGEEEEGGGGHGEVDEMDEEEMVDGNATMQTP